MIRPAILLLFVTIGSLTAGALRPGGELGVAAWRAGASAKVTRPDAPAGEVGRQILPTAGLDAELCASMTTGGGAEPLFPWHAAVLPREAAPALGTEERARALLLAGRGEEAWSVLTSPDVGSGPQAAYLRAWAAAAGGRPEAALLLEPFTAAAVPLPCRAPALRLAARELATSGDLPGSLAQLAALRAALPEIPDYVLLWSIEAVELSAAASRGPAVDAPRESTPRVAPATGPDPEALYRDLLALHPPAGVVRSADLARAGLFERARQAPRARSLLAALVSRSPRAERPALLLRLARVEASPASREQRQREIVERHPDSEEALALLAPQLAGEGSRLRLSARDSARVLAAHGRARDAVQALTPTTDPALLALRGEIRLRNDEYLPAARDFQEAIARGGASAALSLELAKAYGRGGEPARARSIYQRMYSEGGARGGATLTYMIADAFHDESALSPPAADSAATWFRRLVDRHAGSTLAPRGLLRLAHLRFARREWVRAESAYREHLRRYPGSEDRRETRYWLARTLQEAGRAGEARELLSGLLQPGAGDYYALLARRRLGGGGESAVASLFGQDVPPPGTFARAWSAAADTSLPAGSPAEGRLRRARALLLLGEREDAQREVDEALRRVGRSGAELRRVAGWALARGFPESAFRIATPLLAGGADPQLARLAYPAAFPDHVVAEARENRLRPELLWAIMRQESRFDPAVRSPAGALGLLQLMPATARREAARARAASFDLADLSRPEPNLHLGAMHLRALLEGLNGEWVAAIAAYNAGSTLARRWSSFPESVTAEGFVERIPFRETRNYVKLILANHAWYADLYSAG